MIQVFFELIFEICLILLDLFFRVCAIPFDSSHK